MDQTTAIIQSTTILTESVVLVDDLVSKSLFVVGERYWDRRINVWGTDVLIAQQSYCLNSDGGMGQETQNADAQKGEYISGVARWKSLILWYSRRSKLMWLQISKARREKVHLGESEATRPPQRRQPF